MDYYHRNYRRNADANLRNVERAWLVASTAENLQQYVIALYRTGEISIALNVLHNLIDSNSRLDLEDVFKSQKLLQEIRNYSTTLINRTPPEVDVYYSGATISIRRNRKKKVLLPFWVISTSVDIEFSGEDYNELEKESIDEDTEDDYNNSAQSYTDALTEYLNDTFNEMLIDTWELEEEDGDTWDSSIEYDVEDENPSEEGYELVDGDFKSTDAGEFMHYIEDLGIDDEITIKGAVVREGDADYKVSYSIEHSGPIRPYHLLAILVGLQPETE